MITAIIPDALAAGVAVICVAELTVKEAALTPPKVTAVAPVKFVPVIETGVVFAHPLDGVKLLIVGDAPVIVPPIVRSLPITLASVFDPVIYPTASNVYVSLFSPASGIFNLLPLFIVDIFKFAFVVVELTVVSPPVLESKSQARVCPKLSFVKSIVKSTVTLRTRTFLLIETTAFVNE